MVIKKLARGFQNPIPLAIGVGDGGTILAKCEITRALSFGKDLF